MVRPVGYNESTVVRIHSKCRCSCGSAGRCHDSSQSPCREIPESSNREQKLDQGPIKESNTDPYSNCKADGSDVDCSGRGVCECGRCVCEQSRLGTVYGKYCEMDDFSCAYEGGLLCGGKGVTHTHTQVPQSHAINTDDLNLHSFLISPFACAFSLTGRGVCVSGECVCEDKWTGESCGCPVSTATCQSANGLICSGRGSCDCGKCVCDDPRYSGSFCERCAVCQTTCQTYWYLNLSFGTPVSYVKNDSVVM